MRHAHKPYTCTHVCTHAHMHTPLLTCSAVLSVASTMLRSAPPAAIASTASACPCRTALCSGAWPCWSSVFGWHPPPTSWPGAIEEGRSQAELAAHTARLNSKWHALSPHPHEFMHVHTHAHTCTHIHAHTCTHMHAHTRMHTHARTHACTHIRMHTRTHTLFATC